MTEVNEEEVIIIESTVILKKIRYKDIIWIPLKSVKVNHSKGNVKKPYVIKWIEKKQVGDIFTKDQFYEKFPKLKKEVASRRRVDEAIQNMILEGCITVHENIPGKYRVLK